MKDNLGVCAGIGMMSSTYKEPVYRAGFLFQNLIFMTAKTS